jgi:hypothetical protein
VVLAKRQYQTRQVFLGLLVQLFETQLVVLSKVLGVFDRSHRNHSLCEFYKSLLKKTPVYILGLHINLLCRFGSILMVAKHTSNQGFFFILYLQYHAGLV